MRKWLDGALILIPSRELLAGYLCYYAVSYAAAAAGRDALRAKNASAGAAQAV